MDPINIENYCHNYFCDWQEPVSNEEKAWLAVRILSMIFVLPAAAISLVYFSVVIYNHFNLSAVDKKINETATEILNNQSPTTQTTTTIDLPDLPKETIQFDKWVADKLKNIPISNNMSLSEARDHLDNVPDKIVRYKPDAFIMKLEIELIDDTENLELLSKTVKFGITKDFDFISVYPNPVVTIKKKGGFSEEEVSFGSDIVGTNNFKITPEIAKAYAESTDWRKIDFHQITNWAVFRLLSGQSITLQSRTGNNHEIIQNWKLILGS